MNASNSHTEPKPSAFEIYVVYDHPCDYPEHWVVRLWKYYGFPIPSLHGALGPRAASTLEDARKLVPSGLTNMGRDSEDDPVIHEVWINETGA